MYNNYTPLQQRQLVLQEYSSTASSGWWTGWMGN